MPREPRGGARASGGRDGADRGRQRRRRQSRLRRRSRGGPPARPRRLDRPRQRRLHARAGRARRAARCSRGQARRRFRRSPGSVRRGRRHDQLGRHRDRRARRRARAQAGGAGHRDRRGGHGGVRRERDARPLPPRDARCRRRARRLVLRLPRGRRPRVACSDGRLDVRARARCDRRTPPLGDARGRLESGLPPRRGEPGRDAREERVRPSAPPQAARDRRLRPAVRRGCGRRRSNARAARRPAAGRRRLARLPAGGSFAAARDRALAGARRAGRATADARLPDRGGGGSVTVEPFQPGCHPLVFDQPRRLTGVESWHRHIPFAFFAVAALEPRTLVELGTWKGDSYCAFCQAAQAIGLPTRGYAVDTWQGDEHTGAYGPEVLDELRAYHDPLYGSFSTLLQQTFDEAATRFADGTIDLPHVDGCHSYEAVSHDVDTWLPKLSPRGVLLLHDTNVREPGFGVWRLWDELSARYSGVAFAHGHGLGVLAVGGEVEPAFREFIAAAGREPVVARFFAALGDRIALPEQ